MPGGRRGRSATREGHLIGDQFCIFRNSSKYTKNDLLHALLDKPATTFSYVSRCPSTEIQIDLSIYASSLFFIPFLSYTFHLSHLSCFTRAFFMRLAEKGRRCIFFFTCLLMLPLLGILLIPESPASGLLPKSNDSSDDLDTDTWTTGCIEVCQRAGRSAMANGQTEPTELFSRQLSSRLNTHARIAWPMCHP
jgi:hypothetical protein